MEEREAGCDFTPVLEDTMRTFFRIIFALMAMSGTMLAASARRGYEE